MQLQFTAVFLKRSRWATLPMLKNCQEQIHRGQILEKVRSNLFEAVEMAIEANRNLFEEEIRDKVMIKEPFAVLTA